jgi:type I restriction enzyme S subunit
VNGYVINRVNSREYLGKSALIPKLDEKIVYESNMMRIRLDHTKVNPIYMITFLQTDFIRTQIAAKTKDAINQSSINQTDVRTMPIRLTQTPTTSRFPRTT